MFKKILAIATVICVIPMMASAASWKLTTRAMSQGGVIDSRNMTGQTVLNGTIAKTYSDATSPTVTVTPDAGFKISKLSENGIISIPPAGVYTSSNTGTSNFSLQATFARLPFSITATAGAGGSVDKSSYPVVYSGVQSPVKSFTFTPNPGQFVSSVTVIGDGAVSQIFNAVTGELVTLPADVGVKVKTTIVVVGTTSVTVAGEFGGSAAETIPVSGDRCQACHDTQGVGAGVYANWSSSVHKTKAVMCYTCHVGANTGGHPGTITSGSVDRKSFNYYVTGANFCVTCHNPEIVSEFSTGGHAVPAGAASCSFCHADTHNVNASCVNCHTPGNTMGLPWPPVGSESHIAYTDTKQCIKCHNTHTAVPTGCDGCHDAPPATASHLKHFGGTVAQAAYGDTKITQEFGANGSKYIFGCGNCHPMDQTKHMNGAVDVELYNYNSMAPAGSLKALSPTTASYVSGSAVLTDARGFNYTNGTCSNVYCHSYKSWTTPTGVPSYSGNCKPDVPADLVITTNYKDITWGGEPLDCTGCHANPPQTSYPTNGGSAGDSHSWIESYGYQNLHTNNHGLTPVSCSDCHNDSVKQANTWWSNGLGARTLGGVPISNFSKHVNGSNDVAFDKTKLYENATYKGTKYRDLSNATYDPQTRTCSNASCHLLRTEVKWGTPYTDNGGWDCARCHSQGYTCPDKAAALSRVPTIANKPAQYASPGYQYRHQVSASEPGGGAITYTLPVAPDGMTMTAAGLITWTPRADQLGLQAPVKVVVSSAASGGSLIAFLEFTVTVKVPEPVITSTPVPTTTVWKPYTYQVMAPTPSGVTPAYVFSLTTAPAGMTISSSTGLISWTPTDLQTGSHPVTVKVTWSTYSTTQSYALQVDPTPIAFTSTPVTTAQTQIAYSYPVTLDGGASLAGVTSYSYSLVTKPSGMGINAITGAISWIPSSTQAGSYPVVVQAKDDIGGYYNRQSFTVVSTASPITITSTPVTSASAGVAYSYPVTATMPGGGTFTYTLPAKPTGMVISTAGVISWPLPTAGTYAVTVQVARGSSIATQSFDVVVSP